MNTDISKCFDTENDKCLLRELKKTGQNCSIEMAKKIDKYYNCNFNIIDRDSLDTYVNNIIDPSKPYSFCSLEGNYAFGNCALITNSPWFTRSKDNLNCTLPDDLITDSRVSIKNGNFTKSILPDLRKKANINQYCQNKWFDWFCIPYYHLGNTYYNSPPVINNININIRTSYDIGTCYKPCELNKVPYTDLFNSNISKCISINEYLDGRFSKESCYTPLAFINLLGNTPENIKTNYSAILTETYNSLKNDKIQYFKQDDNVYNSINKYNIDTIADSNNFVIDCIKSIKINLINFDLFYNNIHDSPIFTEDNVIEPKGVILQIVKNQMTPNRLLNTYNIAHSFYIDYLKPDNQDIINRFIAIYNVLLKIYDNTDKSFMQLSTFEMNTIKGKIEYDNFKTTFNNIPFIKKLNLYFKIFIKSCNVCFDGNTSFSRLIIQNLNINYPTNNFEYFTILYDKNKINYIFFNSLIIFLTNLNNIGQYSLNYDNYLKTPEIANDINKNKCKFIYKTIQDYADKFFIDKKIRINLDFKNPDDKVYTEYLNNLIKSVNLTEITDYMKNIVILKNTCSDKFYFLENLDVNKPNDPIGKIEYPDFVSYITYLVYFVFIIIIVYILLILYELIGPYFLSFINWIYLQTINYIIYIKNNSFNDKYQPDKSTLQKTERDFENIKRRYNVVNSYDR